MKILLIDNGSPLQEPLRGALRAHTVDVLGYPCVPSILLARAGAAARVILSGSGAPLGVDLAYAKDILAAVRAIRVPVLGIGSGAALLLEAHGGKVKRTGGEFTVKRIPPGWREEGGVFMDDSGNAFVSGRAPEWKAALDGFLSKKL